MEQVPWSPTGSCTVICALGSLSQVKYVDTYFANYKQKWQISVQHVLTILTMVSIPLVSTSAYTR